jgi:sulfate permease, SulP family
MNSLIHRILPFLRWFPMNGTTLKADFIAGVTVALVIIPQSMAYAQLAGLPAYYGLYAAFLPVAVAAMWGSSHQLGTGPVAVVSLLTASSLSVFAAPGTEQFIALAIMLALMVGLVQLALGVFKLGVIVNFLSHPVIVGFTNAAAIIIALSQVSKIFGVPMGRSEHFIVDIWGVVKQIGDTHYPTFLIGVLAIVIMWAIRRYKPSMPGVLIAVAVTTTISYFTHFSANSNVTLDRIADKQVVALANDYRATDTNLEIAGQAQ